MKFKETVFPKWVLRPGCFVDLAGRLEKWVKEKHNIPELHEGDLYLIVQARLISGASSLTHANAISYWKHFTRVAIAIVQA
jgi:hypothetical protein